MIGWQQKLRQRNRLDRKRRERLFTKAQRLGVLPVVSEIIATVRTWNKRRGMVSRKASDARSTYYRYLKEQ
jgi:hypothetical protein